MSLDLFIRALGETIYMVSVSGFFACICGFPIGILLFSLSRGEVLESPKAFACLNAMVNIFRSVPFIILLVALIPVTRFLVGSSIGSNAAIVPLSIAASPFMARLVEAALKGVPKGLSDAMASMGAAPWQILFLALIPEALPVICNGVTLMLVNLIGYSAMAGTVGGGGLGDLAIRYGYQRFDVQAMLVTVVCLIVLVQVVQGFGDLCSRRLKKGG